MRENTIAYTFEEYQKFIEEFAPCMDSYPYFYDVKRDLYCISSKALERFALPSNQFTQVLETHTEFIYEEDFTILLDDLKKMQSGEKDEHDIEYRWMGKDGKPVWVNCRGRVIRDEDGSLKCMFGCINEIAARRKADNTTSLKSISSIAETMETFCRVAAGGYTLHIGIDNFKVINERFGHEYGDFILHGVAECITACIGPGQEVYHVIADEFLVVDYFADTADGAKDLYHAICEKIDKFIEKNRYETVFTVSCGVLSCKELGGMSFDEFIKLSEFALNRAKTLGKNQVYFFCLEDYENFLYKNTILSVLKESVSADFAGFDVTFQSTNDGSDVLNAVLSYTMPSGEILPIETFIPVLEESGLIIPVGKWMIDNAISFSKAKQAEEPGVKVDVTIPYVKVLKSPFVMAFFRMLKESGVNLDLEELDAVLTTNVYEAMRGFGVKIRIEGNGIDDSVDVKVVL